MNDRILIKKRKILDTETIIYGIVSLISIIGIYAMVKYFPLSQRSNEQPPVSENKSNEISQQNGATEKPASMQSPEINSAVISNSFTVIIVFNTPEHAIEGKEKTIVLLMSKDQSYEILGKTLAKQSKGNKVEDATIEVTPIAEAHLTGQDMSVTPITPIRQPVKESGTTRWKWLVTAKNHGKKVLFLTINKVVEQNPPQTIETFRREIIVDVDPKKELNIFLEKHMPWIVAAIITILAAFLSYQLGKKRFKMKIKRL